MKMAVSKVAFLALSALLAARGGTAGKPRSDEEKRTRPSSAELNPFSPWKSMYIQRGLIINPGKRKDFNDSLFEYRWKSEWIINAYVCTIEIRHDDDAEDSHTIPEVQIAYFSRQSHAGSYAARNVLLGGKDAHVYLRTTDCETVDIVYWNK